jgi:hypothetical protein
MIGILISLTFFVGLIKLNSTLSTQREHFVNNGIAEKELVLLRLFMWLYVGVLLIVNIPVSPLLYTIHPIPIILIVLVPGVLKGKRLNSLLEVSGTDRGVAAGRVADKVAWLGIGIGIYILASWVFNWGQIILM